MFEIKIKMTCSIGSGWTSSNENNRSPKSLAERWARLWVRGSVLDLARARLELGTTFLGICLVLDRFRDLIEDGYWLRLGLVLGLDSAWLGLAQAR